MPPPTCTTQQTGKQNAGGRWQTPLPSVLASRGSDPSVLVLKLSISPTATPERVSLKRYRIFPAVFRLCVVFSCVCVVAYHTCLEHAVPGKAAIERRVSPFTWRDTEKRAASNDVTSTQIVIYSTSAVCSAVAEGNRRSDCVTSCQT